MKWYCYEIRNNLNGKYYRGKSSAEVPEQDSAYLGSGPAIKAAIKKYGKENFTKTILAVFNTEQEAYNYESQIITSREIQDSNCYNMQEGGLGGSVGAVYMIRGDEFTRVDKGSVTKYEQEGWIKGIPEYLKKLRSERLLGKTHKGCVHTQEWKEEHSRQLKGKANLKNRGRVLSEETRRKMSLSHTGIKRGARSKELRQAISLKLKQRNREHPKVKINNGIVAKYVEKKDLQSWLGKGWFKGRLLSKK
jgi:hypothetical protein